MAVAHGGRGALSFEGSGGIGVHGLVQPEPVCSGQGLDKRLVDQGGQQPKTSSRSTSSPGADGLGGGERKAGREDRQTVQEAPFAFAQ